ncbi:MAG: LPS assembly protein LptD [Planctomycetes bacterium]|nr:LPS assembly protein LptD [Planctomycetota bacterium]
MVDDGRALSRELNRFGDPINSLRVLVLLGGLAIASAPAAGQQIIPITGDQLSGFVLPIEPLAGDIRLEALRAWAWDVDDTKRLLLHGEVKVHIGRHTFDSDAAVVWINRIPTAEGLINQIAVYFDHVDDPTKRAGLGVSGRQLLMTASTRGAVELNVALLDRQQPRRSSFVDQAQRRLADYLQRLLAQPPPLEGRPQIEAAATVEPPRPRPGGPIAGQELVLPTEITLPPPLTTTPPLFVPQGTVRFSADRTTVTTGEDENVTIAIGSIVVQYVADRGDDRWSELTISADRAVVFSDPGSIEEMLGGQMTAESIRGIYLEGNVIATADEGEYTIRAPQVYYDFRTNQAIMLEAVLRTYARELRGPLYARAQEMRQIAANQWTARRVRVSTSEFFTPHLAIGASRITITRRPSTGDPEQVETRLDARHATLQAGGIPFIYFPRFSGTIDDIPLRSIDVGTRDNDGVRIRTKWNPFSLLGIEPPEGIEADLGLDHFTKRGSGVGLDLSYDLGTTQGAVELYGLLDDGVDRTSSGLEVNQDDAYRGVALWDHKVQLNRYWTLQAEAAWISDESFITTWHENDFTRRREYQTSAYLKHLKGNAALTLLAKYDLNDFISNSYLLASRQYQVNKLPELTYRRYGDSLFGDRITYSGETRVSRMQFSFERSTPRELGVPGAAFGLGNDDRISDALRAQGLVSSFVNRFDTRHELALPLAWGVLKVVPFVVGRLTAYDEDFDEFSSQADQARVFGAAGVRLNTQFQRIDNSVENRLFDLHRLRHLVEPRMALWYGHSDVSETDLPVYDEAVESIGTGAVAELGLRNTWQTQRGGPGRWRSVDVLTVDAAVVLNSNDTNTESPAPQFFEYRPEYSQFGDHVYTSMIWLLGDHLSVVGETTYDLDNSIVARGSIGAELRHSPLFSTSVEYRFLNASSNELLELGWTYQLTPKYSMSLSPQWDFRRDEFRAVSVRVTRRFPDFDLTFQIRRDEIRDDTSIGASIGLVEF